MFSRCLVSLTIVLSAYAAEETKVTRAGSFWIQTITGSEPAPAGGRLQISTQGSVTLRGGPDNQVQYTVTRRSKAKNEAEAKQLLQQVKLKLTRRGDLTSITIAIGGRIGEARS